MSSSVSANKSRWLKSGLIALGAILVLAFVFGAGFYAGRASAFPLGAFPNLPRGGNRSGHGAIGAIQSIDGPKITIKMRDGKTQIILVDSDTRLEKNFLKVGLADFKVSDQIIVIGSPNSDGEIKARLVGIVDPSFRPPRASPTSNDPR